MMKRIFLLSLFVFIAAVASKAQMAQFKALYLYNFAKNVGWPEGDNGNDFVITVIGDNELAGKLDELAKTKKVGNRKVVVRQAATVSSADASQIFYLGESKSAQISALVSTFGTNKALIVSGKQGHCNSGAAISFVPDGGKLNYEVCQRNVKKSGLALAAKIVQLGIEVQ